MTIGKLISRLGLWAVLISGCSDGSTDPTPVPGPPAALPAPAGYFVSLSAGYHHVCGLSQQHEVLCWGWGSSALGLRDLAVEAVDLPTKIASSQRFSMISAGAGVTCGLVAETAWCWGSNEFGQLGTDEPFQGCQPAPCHPAPTVISADIAFTNIAAGGAHTCGIAEDGTGYCWGYGAYGRLGNNGIRNEVLPVRVEGGHRFTAILPGGTHTCGLSINGLAFCWGYGEGGQIGDGFSATARVEPTAVSGNHSFQMIAIGTAHSCALDDAAKVWCWGVNPNGQLGDGSVTSSAVPVRVPGPAFKSITSGANHNCAITLDDAAYCWGDNDEGQLGDDTKADRSTPTPVAGNIRFAELTAGYHFTCGISLAGEAYCWGLNYRGVLGNGSEELYALRPTRVAAPAE